jgi:hypothetical protein
MTENAKKPWPTKAHKEIIEFLSHPNAVATVQLPNGDDKNYDITVTTLGRLAAEHFPAFDEMVEQRIVVQTGPETYRLAHNHTGKYRKNLRALAWEEIKFLMGRA